MTDVQLLLVIVLALALVQSVRIVPSDLLILQKRLFRQWRITRPFFRFGTGRLAVAWLDPFSILGAAFAVRPMPFAISRDGFVSTSPEEPLVSNTDIQQAVPTSQLSQIESIDTEIAIGGKRLLTFLHPEQAVQTAGDIRQRGTQGPTTTADAITQRWFDDTAFRKCFDQARDVTAFLRYSSFLFVLSVISFLVVWDRAGFNYAYWILGSAVFFWILSIILLWRAHRALRPAYRGSRVFSLFEAVFYPISLIRAADSLTLPTTEGHHPLAAAIALEQPDLIIQTGAEALRRLRYPIKSSANSDLLGESVLSQARKTMLEEVESQLIRHNYLPEEILERTTIVDSNSKYFCPRCLAGYLNAIGDCPDCPGVRVLPNDRRAK